MKFQPKTAKEVAQGNIWDKGTYPFEILEASDEISKAGKEMIKLKVKVFKDTGASQNLFDYLLGDTMEYKLRHIAEACGLLSDYETGKLEAYQFIGKTGHCKVGIQAAKGDYEAKNSINDYVVGVATESRPLKDVVGNDGIPF